MAGSNRMLEGLKRNGEFRTRGYVNIFMTPLVKVAFKIMVGQQTF